MTMLYYFFRVMTVISQATKEGHDGSLGKNESRLERIQVITITQLFVSSDFEVENWCMGWLLLVCRTDDTRIYISVTKCEYDLCCQNMHPYQTWKDIASVPALQWEGRLLW